MNEKTRESIKAGPKRVAGRDDPFVLLYRVGGAATASSCVH